jgi:hypothetical protein
MADPVVSKFRKAVEARGGAIEETTPDVALVAYGDRRVQLSLASIRSRIQAGEAADDVIEAFVDLATAAPVPADAEAFRAGLRLMLEQLDVVADHDFVVRPISPRIGVVLAWTDPQETAVQLLLRSNLSSWSLTEEEALSIAAVNMDQLLASTPIEVDEAGDLRVGMLATDSVFKASLIGAPSLQNRVSAKLGWPLLAVVPCRDFVFLIPDNARHLVGRVAGVVMREFEASAYPLSPELFSVSDAGIRALGSFAAAAKSS